MISNQSLIDFPEFANNGNKSAPEKAKYAQGFVPADVLPAEWTNYFFNGATKGITDLNAGVSSIEAEINNVLADRGILPDQTATNQLLLALQSFKAETLLAAHPVGSLYWTSKNENPAVTFGGTWQQIKDKFILAAGDTYKNNATGGEATVILTIGQMPSHTHTFTGQSVTSGTQSANHTHSFSHTHGGYTSTNGNHNHLTAWGSDMTSFKWGYSYQYPVTGENSHKNTADNLPYTSSDGNHSHTIKTNSQSTSTTGNNSTNHTHTVTAQGTNSNAGGNLAHNNMPPYTTRYCWERTA